MTKEKQLQLLEETITYYTENPLRRCIDNDGCYYSGDRNKLSESDGCAIGRLIPNELALELDKQGQLGVEEIFEDLPIEIQVYGNDFLNKLQSLHDSKSFWDADGLTENGKIFIENFKLRIKTNGFI